MSCLALGSAPTIIVSVVRGSELLLVLIEDTCVVVLALVVASVLIDVGSVSIGSASWHVLGGLDLICSRILVRLTIN